MAERLIKSKERVKKFAEVYTPVKIVKEMCDNLPAEAWEDVDKTFLEPSCGNGNFLVEILERKLKLCKCEKDYLRAFRSIFGVDIQADNIAECKARLLTMVEGKVSEKTKEEIKAIMDRNIIVGDFLKMFPPSGQLELF